MKNVLLIYFYLILTSILVFDVVMTFYDYSFYGYWSDKIISWLWIFGTISFILNFWKKKLAKIYLLCIAIFLFLTLIPMAIPFFAMLQYINISNSNQRFQLSSDYRIEKQRKLLSIDRIYIYKRAFGILEKNIARPVFDDIINDDNNDYNPLSTSTEIQSVTLLQTYSNAIKVEYVFNGQKRIAIHLFDGKDGY